jgi:hypothetical protein
VYETARAQYGEGTLEAQEWVEATLTRLSLNELGVVVGGLLRMKPRTPEAEDSQLDIRASLLRLHGHARGRKAVTLNKSGTLPMRLVREGIVFFVPFVAVYPKVPHHGHLTERISRPLAFSCLSQATRIPRTSIKEG